MTTKWTLSRYNIYNILDAIPHYIVRNAINLFPLFQNKFHNHSFINLIKIIKFNYFEQYCLTAVGHWSLNCTVFKSFIILASHI